MLSIFIDPLTHKLQMGLMENKRGVLVCRDRSGNYSTTDSTLIQLA
jgi:hypothetical protein